MTNSFLLRCTNRPLSYDRNTRGQLVLLLIMYILCIDFTGKKRGKKASRCSYKCQLLIKSLAILAKRINGTLSIQKVENAASTNLRLLTIRNTLEGTAQTK